MLNFRLFVEKSGEVEESLKKLPKGHRDLVRGVAVQFEPSHTLKGDDDHVGVIMASPKKQIKIATPWNYSRSFVLYHEIGHLVWERFVRGTPLEKEWERVAKQNKDRKKNEPPIENFCHAYGAYYSTHPPATHNHPAWREFIRELPG